MERTFVFLFLSVLYRSVSFPSGDSMTISSKTQRDNYDLALRVIMEKLGDAYFSSLIDPCSIEFQGVIRTTWEDLVRDGLLNKEDGTGIQRYRLTPMGWIEGLERLGKLKEPTFRQDLKKLLASLKSWVEDRLPKHPLPDQIAGKAGLSLEFIGNVLETKLLERQFPNDHVDVEWRGLKRAVTIPGVFGRKKVS